MLNCARNLVKPFPESNSFGIIPIKSKSTFFVVILRLTHDLSVLEKLNFASLFLEIQDLPTVRLSCFLDQFISTFSYRNLFVKFQELKLSTKNSLRTIWRRTVISRATLFKNSFWIRIDRKVCRPMEKTVLIRKLRSFEAIHICVRWQSDYK